ncbi:M48 family metalloprotease [Ewingella americana]|nr:M48 family metalloprotease [Ewingella americana]
MLLTLLFSTSIHASVNTFYWRDESINPRSFAKDTSDMLPDMGTTASATLSIGQEIQMGDFYVRQMRRSTPIIYDPLLQNYIGELGNKLAASAHSVKTPFHFFIINNSELNAFAFFGGNVVIHSAIFSYSDNESELASVMAHEISHVTQRHLARAIEDQAHAAPLAWVGALGSLILATVSPQAGMAALTSTMAGASQGIISFTQGNEQEADRIGMQVLTTAGYAPQAMATFLQKLGDQSHSSVTPPEMLLTHPLPASRLSDIRNRANQIPAKTLPISQDFLLAKARLMTMYGKEDQSAADAWLVQMQSGGAEERIAEKYGRTIQYFRAGKYAQASEMLQLLIDKSPNNPWFLDVATDIDLAQKHGDRAVSRLEKASAIGSNKSVLQLNLANAYMAVGKNKQAHALLKKYTFAHPEDLNGWDLLSQSAAANGSRDQELAARAETLALKSKLDEAVTLLSQASAMKRADRSEQARYDARIDQLREMQKRFRIYEKG